MKLKWIFSALLLFSLTTTQAADFNGLHRCRCYLEIEPFYAKINDTLLTNGLFAVKVADPEIQGDFKAEYSLEPKGTWGGRIGIGYAFPGCTNAFYGLSLEYTYLNQDNSECIVNDARDHTGLPVLTPAEYIDITDQMSAKFSHACSRLKQKYDTVDLLAKKNCLLQNCAHFNLFAGIRYFHLNEQLQNHYFFKGDIENVTVSNIYDVNFSNDLDTIGPEVGAGIAYPFACNLSITGQLAGLLLYGQSKSQFNNAYRLSPQSALGDPTDLTSSYCHRHSAQVFPALSGKVGILLHAKVRQCATFEMEAGYRGDIYFNAADDVAYQHLLAGDDVFSKGNYQNIEVSGPYLCLTAHI